MAGRPSNRERIARAALEAEAAAKEKASAKKAAPKASAKKSSAKKLTGRTRIVWLLNDASGRPVKTFLYPDEKKARAEAEKLTAETGKTHFVSRGEEPFE